MSGRKVGTIITAGAVVAAFVVSAMTGTLPGGIGFPTTFATTTTAPPHAISVSGDSSAPILAPPQAFMPPTTMLMGMTPPMGWNGYNHFHTGVTAATVEAAATALVTSGMKAAGYTYVNLDGGWDLRRRGAGGNLAPDPAKF